MKGFKLEKIPLETLLDLLIKLYESGVDYVDLAADNSDPIQDKLLIFTKEGYINPEYYDEEGLAEFEILEDEEEPKRKAPKIEARKLSDDDIDKLL